MGAVTSLEKIKCTLDDILESIKSKGDAGGIGGGSTGGGAEMFEVSVIPKGEYEIAVDKTFEEIKSAYDEGKKITLNTDLLGTMNAENFSLNSYVDSSTKGFEAFSFLYTLYNVEDDIIMNMIFVIKNDETVTFNSK